MSPEDLKKEETYHKLFKQAETDPSAAEVIADAFEENGDLASAQMHRGKAEDLRQGNYQNKEKYLYEFEREFDKKFKKQREQYPSTSQQAMWTNAHMYYGMGIPAKMAVKKLYNEKRGKRIRAAKKSYKARRLY